MGNATPGGGHSVIRYGLVSLAGIGIGLQDAVLLIFLMESLLKYGATRFVAFMPLAGGGFISIITTPAANVLASRRVRYRQAVSFSLLALAAVSNIGLAFTLRSPNGNVMCGIILAAVYRVCTQTANFVPVLHDAAKVQGDEENLPRRRAIATCWYYVMWRIGYISSSAVIAARPGKELEDLFLHLLCAAIAALVFIGIAAASSPNWAPGTEPAPTPKEEESKLGDYLNEALMKADKRLYAMYIESTLHGAAFGLLGAVVASFFNDRVFKASPGFPKGVKWSAYSTLTGTAISLVVDAVLPFLVFIGGSASMPVLWVSGAGSAAVIFAVLRQTEMKITAMVLFGLTSVAVSTHNLFSLLAAAAWVEPKFRGTTFSIRGATNAAGIAIGALIGGILAQVGGGFQNVMLLCAGAAGGSAVAAAFAGSVSEVEVDGAAVNANTLVEHLLFGSETKTTSDTDVTILVTATDA